MSRAAACSGRRILALWALLGMVAVMVEAKAYSDDDDDDDDDDDGCGDMCQIVVGFLVDQFFRRVLVPGLVSLLTSSSLLLWWAGVAMLLAFVAWALYVLLDFVRSYIRATPSKRARMVGKSTARGLGHMVSAVVS